MIYRKWLPIRFYIGAQLYSCLHPVPIIRVDNIARHFATGIIPTLPHLSAMLRYIKACK